MNGHLRTIGSLMLCALLIGSQAGIVAGADASPAAAPTLASIAMNPLAAEIATGGHLQLYVEGTYTNGSVRGVAATGETFVSSKASAAIVSAAGIVSVPKTALGGNTATISATDKLSGLVTSPAHSTVVTVQPTLASIAVSPLADELLPGATLQLSVLGTLTNGTVVFEPLTGMTFKSSNTSVATVTAAGLVTVSKSATALATTTISVTDAAAGLASSRANSLVLTAEEALSSVALSPLVVEQAAGGTWQLAVTGGYNNGITATLPPANETFSSSDSSVATVDSAGIITVAPDAASKARATISVTDNASGVTSTGATSTTVIAVATGKAPTANSTTAATTTATTNALCTAIEPFYWEIGDKEAEMLSGSLGTNVNGDPVMATTPYAVASATKLVYASYIAQWRGAATNVTAKDISFLHFTSGYSDMGSTDNACDGANTVIQCLAFLNPQGLPFSTRDPATIGQFDYDSGHMENHAVLADTPLATLNYSSLGETVGTALGGSNITLAFSQPLMAGGLYTDANNYGLFLRNILNGSLYMNTLLGTSAVCTSIVACPTSVAYSPIPEAWHYSLGHWVEDDPTTNGDGSFSSPGAAGYYPWIEPTKTYYGLISRYNNTGNGLQEGYKSAQCGRLIRAAWMTGIVQTGTIPTAPKAGA